MKINRIYFFLLIVFFANCKKENCIKPDTKVTGTVIDYKTNQPVPNATVTLSRAKRNFMGFDGYKNIKNKETDGTGIFTINFCRDKKEYYYLFVSKDNYEPTSSYGGTPINDSINTHFIIMIVPK